MTEPIPTPPMHLPPESPQTPASPSLGATQNLPADPQRTRILGDLGDKMTYSGFSLLVLGALVATAGTLGAGIIGACCLAIGVYSIFVGGQFQGLATGQALPDRLLTSTLGEMVVLYRYQTLLFLCIALIVGFNAALDLIREAK